MSGFQLAHHHHPATSSPIVPRWLTHRTGNGTTRTVVRTVLILVVSVLVGLALAQLFTPDAYPVAIAKEDASNHHKIDHYSSASTIEEISNFSQEHDNGEQPDPAGTSPHLSDEATSSSISTPMSLYSKVTSKLSSLHLWPSSGSSYRQTTEETTSPSPVSSSEDSYGQPRPAVAKLTILYGDPNPRYERALATHSLHNKLHGYTMHTLRQSILDDVWSKPAYILSVLLRELAKPIARRAVWLLWVDADTVILNPHVPVESLLPPADFDDINLLVSADWNGLNNGVFPLRVNAWSVDLLSAILAYPHYNPNTSLTFRDQSAMSSLLSHPKFSSATIWTPQRWFNAYQGEVNETLAPHQVRRGDLLVHFAGVPDRDARMEHWLRRAESHSDEWEVDFRYTSYVTEARDFWDDRREDRRKGRKALSTARKEAQVFVDDVQAALETFHDIFEEKNLTAWRDAITSLQDTLSSSPDDAEILKEALVNAKFLTQPLSAAWADSNAAVVADARNAAFEAERLSMANSGLLEREKLVPTDGALYLLKQQLVREPMDYQEITTRVVVLRQAMDELRRISERVKGEGRAEVGRDGSENQEEEEGEDGEGE